MKLNLVGKITSTHGIKGEVKVKSDSSFNRFNIGNILYIKNNDKLKEIKINSHRIHKGYDLITFNNITNINDVLEYVGLDVFVDVEGLDELEEGEFYFDDLIGLEAFDDSGKLIGIVNDINEVPQGIILEVKKVDKSIAFIPFVDEFIKEINIEEGRIVITPIEGLL